MQAFSTMLDYLIFISIQSGLQEILLLNILSLFAILSPVYLLTGIYEQNRSE